MRADESTETKQLVLALNVLSWQRSHLLRLPMFCLRPNQAWLVPLSLPSQLAPLL